MEHANRPAGEPASGAAAEALRALAGLPGVAGAVDSLRTAVDRLYGHRVMRRRSSEISAEAALRGARASAALAGADWALEEVRRRSDFGADPEARTVGAALRVTAEAGELRDIWRASPLRALARLHLVAAGGPAPTVSGHGEDRVGRPRREGEPVTDDDRDAAAGLPLPDATALSVRLDGLKDLVLSAGSPVPALVTAAVVHGELLALRPFGTFDGLVARAAQRIVLTAGGLDPKAVAPAEVGLAELGRTEYAAALRGYASGTAEGVGAWIAHCGRAVELGVRESVAVCEALQRGAA
ncbi:oxidoreductase [Streptomyces sp. YIM 98790]|uniref:oxidoreductase n=1 Tax=Streptomyces sp. YIM 98790 TaxID=2689077 RepID=UPI001409CF54|nr:oxidoreductase [Streptomyces sp. YIM 98790]